MDNPPEGVVPATREMAARLAATLSPEHCSEVADTCGITPEMGVWLSCACSAEAYAFVRNARPVFLMGVERASPITGSAMLWMLASDSIRLYAKASVRAARWGLRRAFAVTGAHELEQYIPEWYDTGIRFAERLGFAVEPGAWRGRSGSVLLRVSLEKGKPMKGKRNGSHGHHLQRGQHHHERVPEPTGRAAEPARSQSRG